MISFSKKVKSELCDVGDKLKVCCGYSLLYGMLFCSKIEGDYAKQKVLNSDVGDLFLYLCNLFSIKKEYDFTYTKSFISIKKDFIRGTTIKDFNKKIIRCGKCKESFLRGVFLVNGNVSDPEKSYRLDLMFDDENKLIEIKELLLDLGINCMTANRNCKYVLYLRKSESIEDFFARVGATSLAFDIMNSKINKDLVNNANRVTNCDSANINKSLLATNKYITVINKLIASDKINSLPEQLKEIALKRIEFKELSFSDLGRQMNPPISKSGVCHRLEKILKFYEESKDK